jgi:hypothetical protein
VAGVHLNFLPTLGDTTGLSEQDKERAGQVQQYLAKPAGYLRQQSTRLHCPSPIGVAVFPHELAPPSRGLVEQQYTVTQWTEFTRGGHFPALEVPDLLIQDLRKFFAQHR